MSIGNLILGANSVTVSHLIRFTTDIIVKCDRTLLQNASDFLLQNATILLQNATVIT